MLRRVFVVLLVVAIVFGILASLTVATADPPGPGSKQCTPGQNNVGGGPGNSGPGDKNGAPLKPPPGCPG
ncbi:MAG: hypothetical protein ABR548_12180 [Actinomycetota bacterium]|nr:hypothetical protein [Actinomycetota bacterium]